MNKANISKNRVIKGIKQKKFQISKDPVETLQK